MKAGPFITLRALDGEYAIARLEADAAIPGWADGPGFVSISRSDEELSVVCLAARVPADIRHDAGWSCLKFHGPFAFDETGIALAVIRPLSDAGIGIFFVSTFDTDYLLLKAENMSRAKALLTQAGHKLV
ncbi:MAG: ACT domain-containing protein [Mesorhizobium sp.]